MPLFEENTYNPFLPMEASEDKIEASLYQRKQRIGEKLDIRLEVKYVKAVPEILRNQAFAMENAFSVSLFTGNTLQTFRQEGLLTNLLKLPYLDLWNGCMESRCSLLEQRGTFAVANQALFPGDMKTFSAVAQRLEAELTDCRSKRQAWDNVDR